MSLTAWATTIVATLLFTFHLEVPMSVSAFVRSLFCCALLATGIAARAQIQFVSSVFPLNGSVGISTDASIVIQCATQISQRSVGRDGRDGAVTIVAEESVVNLPPDRWKQQGLPGRYRIVNGSVLEFTPMHLEASTTYHVRVDGLIVYDGIDVEPRSLPPFDIVFRTADDVPRVRSTSIASTDALRCSDGVEFGFTAPITPFKDKLPKILRIEERHGTGSRIVPIDIVIGEGGRVIRLQPRQSWKPGSALRIQCTMSNITGDAADDRQWTIPVRDAAHLLVRGRSTDGRPIPQEIEDALSMYDRAVTSRDTVPVHVPEWFPDTWRFHHWESRSLGSVDGNTKRELAISPSCEELVRDIVLTAVIERLDSTAVKIEVGTGGMVQIYDPTWKLRMTLRSDSVVMLNDQLPLVHCLAIPDPAYVLAPGSQANSTITPRTAVGGGIVNPKFIPLNPGVPPRPNNELYRLQGLIENAEGDGIDPGPKDAWFTTDSYFEDTQTGERTICVQTKDCWVITGYIITGTNKSEYYDDPPTGICVTAPLLDPMNTIVFYVQRRNIQLRIDEVLIHGDDPTAIVAGAVPHPDVKIEVYKRRQVNGIESWYRLNALRCTEPGTQLHFVSAAAQCGDRLKIRIKGSVPRGQPWKFFADVPRYIVPDGGVSENGWTSYELDVQPPLARFPITLCDGAIGVGTEIRCRACFGLTFGIDGIALRLKIRRDDDRSHDVFEQRWLDPLFYYDKLAEEPLGGRQLEYIPRHGTSVKVRFTAPLDIRTLRAGGMTANSEGNIEPTTPWLDGLDFTVASMPENTSFYPQTGGPITTAEFRINDPTTSPRLQALPLGQIFLTCTTGLTSIDGEPLAGDVSYVLNTMEAPGLGLILDAVELSWDGDNDFAFFENNGDIYHVSYGGVFGIDKLHGADVAFQRLPRCDVQQGANIGECTFEQSDKDDPMNMGEHLMLIEPFGLDLKDVIGMHIETWDEDCKDKGDCFVNRVNDLLDYVTDQVDSKESANTDNGSSFGLTDIVKFGAQFMKTLLPPDEQDQPLGEANLVADLSSLWSATKGGVGRYSLFGQNVTYHMRTLFYPRLRVVR